MGSSLRTLDPMLSPPSAWAEMFWHMFLQSQLQSSTPTPKNSEVGQWLLQIICRHLPRTVPQQVVLLDLNLDEHLRLPIIWLVAKTLSSIFSCRMDKKACTMFNTRATLEASIMLLRKTRHRKAAETLQNLVSQSWYFIINLHVNIDMKQNGR